MSPILGRRSSPNPFNQSPEITFEIRHPDVLSLEIHDAGGEVGSSALKDPG